MQILLKNKTTLIAGGENRCACATHERKLIKMLRVNSVEECYKKCCTGYNHAPIYMFEIRPEIGKGEECPQVLQLYEDAGLIVWDETAL